MRLEHLVWRFRYVIIPAILWHVLIGFETSWDWLRTATTFIGKSIIPIVGSYIVIKVLLLIVKPLYRADILHVPEDHSDRDWTDGGVFIHRNKNRRSGIDKTDDLNRVPKRWRNRA